MRHPERKHLMGRGHCFWRGGAGKGIAENIDLWYLVDLSYQAIRLAFRAAAKASAGPRRVRWSSHIACHLGALCDLEQT